MRNEKNGHGIFWGVVLVVIGILFLLNNFGVDISWGKILKLWPVILIYFGVKEIVKYYRSKGKLEEKSGEIVEDTNEEL